MRTQHPRLRLVAVLCPLLLAACSGDELSRNFGLTRDAPDEFKVTTRAPLSLPPDYQLRPPRPGAPRPQERSTKDAAEATLVPQAALETGGPGGGQAGSSPGQQALLQQAGPAAPADIRRQVDVETSREAGNRSFTDRLMFWRSAPPPGTVVDPQRESQRLRENAALGQSVDQGDTPIIQRKQRGWLDGLL